MAHPCVQLRMAQLAPAFAGIMCCDPLWGCPTNCIDVSRGGATILKFERRRGPGWRALGGRRYFSYHVFNVICGVRNVIGRVSEKLGWDWFGGRRLQNSLGIRDWIITAVPSIQPVNSPTAPSNGSPFSSFFFFCPLTAKNRYLICSTTCVDRQPVFLPSTFIQYSFMIIIIIM